MTPTLLFVLTLCILVVHGYSSVEVEESEENYEKNEKESYEENEEESYEEESNEENEEDSFEEDYNLEREERDSYSDDDFEEEEVSEISTSDTCGHDEQYYECKPFCSNRCNPLKACPKICIEGCFCKEGLVLNDEDKCVRKDECNQDKCKKNEQYYTCKPTCNNTCENYGRKGPCPRYCTKGCFCKKGLVLRKDGECVKPEKCKKVCPQIRCTPDCPSNANAKPCPKCECKKPPTDECGKHEVLLDCGSACPPICGVKDPKFCTLQCVKGCFCKKGYIREKKGGICIPASQCPSNTCGENEELSDCCTACPATCANRNPVCTKECKEGCSCKEGFIREEEGGKCIPESKCPNDGCERNEEYSKCGTACQATCANKNPFCTKQCVEGCFCKKGYIREEKGGTCIKKSQCPKDECERNEEYSKCGTACQATCANKDPFCTKQCVEGCFCKKGYIREEKGGKCIPKSQCPKECGKNEIIVKCAKPKWCNTCGIRGNCKLKTCSEGCDCKPGFYRNDKGICIPKSQCPGNCGRNEEYSKCVNPCNDCETRGNCQFLVCNKGCDCIPGYRRYRKTCIKESQCPKKCGKNEIIVKCAKPKSCNTCGIRGNCKLKTCLEGCDCKPEFYRNDKGICIPKSQCPEKCKKDEQYYECTPSCKNNCKTYFNPGIRCGCGEPACFCKEGLVKDGDRCVRPEKCKEAKKHYKDNSETTD